MWRYINGRAALMAYHKKPEKGVLTLGFVAEEGSSRKTLKQNGFQQIVNDDKVMVRARIGSRPPKCEKRCRSCGPCEAIQVPTNPQEQNGKINNNPSTVSTDAYERGEGNFVARLSYCFGSSKQILPV
ncbi:hypothetical protein RIF29_36923 [Crotalaria pallida]|uniref:Epidermal patterning factor-like protein n=1 Tax=Crotalaria pallida TaxID=3830 RepID=A0AAN9EC08_CROPI